MVMTSELVIVRHGEAVCNVIGVAGGEKGCTGLTSRGREQAQLLAERLAAEHAQRPFDALLTTPRLRARQTAQEIAVRLGLPLTVENDLRGPEHGEGDGQPWHRIRALFGGNARRYPDRAYARGSETWHQYLRRAIDALRGVLERNVGRRILIAGHRETVEAAHTLMLGLPAESSGRLGFVVDHAALTRWQRHLDRYGQSIWKLAAHNDVGHLSR